MKNYEILLCEEYLVASGGITPPTNSSVDQELRVRFVAEIGSSSSAFSGKAIDPIFYTKIDGTHELTFELPKYYFDENTGEKVFNELTDLLVNKCKILLRFPDEGEDYYLVINERTDEEKDGQFKYTYSCNDAFIEELSKTGYGLVFDDDVEGNGLADIHQLAGEILKDTDWGYDDDLTGFMGEYRTEVNYNTTQQRYDTVQIPHPVHPIKYIPELKRYCYKLDPSFCGEKEIYCYEDTEQVTSNTVKNILYNTSETVDSDGWNAQNGFIEISKDYNLKFSSSTEASFKVLNSTAVNTNTTLRANQPYLLRIKYAENGGGKDGRGITAMEIYKNSPFKDPQGIDIATSDMTFSWENTVFNPSSAPSQRYYVFKPQQSISNPYISFTVNAPVGSYVEVESIQLFELKTRKSSNMEGTSEELYRSFLQKLYTGTCIDISSNKTDLRKKKINDDTTESITTYNASDIVVLPNDGNLSAYTHKKTMYFSQDPDSKEITYLDFETEIIDSSADIIETETDSFPILDPLDENVWLYQGAGEEIGGNGKYYNEIGLSKIYKLKSDGKYYQYYQLTKDGRTGGAWDLALLGYGVADKRRTLKAEKSNRFNLLQELAELFKTWCIFETKIGENNELQKKVYFRENVINPNFSGFHSGVNLRSLERKVESDEIVTKMYVEDVESDFAEDGFVTIRTSSLNPWGENYYYNFKYYGEQKLLSSEGIIKLEDDKKELYSTVKGINATIYELNDKIINAKMELKNLNSRLESLSYCIAAAMERIGNIDGDLSNPDISAPDKQQLREDQKSNEKRKSEYETEYVKSEKAKNILQAEYDEWVKQVEKKQEEKKGLIQKFENTYAQFIKEGVWSDSTYSDNDTYFLDSQKVSLTSAMPKMSWNISAIDGSVLHELEDFKVKVGDQTILVDNEFFPSKEAKEHVFEVLISGIKEHLDDGTKNEIEIRNYLTRFEDLFQRISAATQTLELNEQTYNRAANFTADGHIDQSLLERSLLENASILANSSDNSYKLDQTGLHLQSVINPIKKLRIVADGIVLSDSLDDEGNEKWTTGISADGINADKITTGSLDTSLIRIYSEGQPSFVWNELGINAYSPSRPAKEYEKIAVIGDSYSVTSSSASGWMKELKNLVGKEKIVHSNDEGGESGSGFSPWYHYNDPKYYFITQLETICNNLDEKGESYPDCLLVCGGFNDKTWCLNDLKYSDLDSETIEGEKTISLSVANWEDVGDGNKRCNANSWTIENLLGTGSLNDYCSFLENFSELKFEDPIPGANNAFYRHQGKDYLMLNGSYSGLGTSGNSWATERSYSTLIQRMEDFNEKIKNLYNKKGLSFPKIILVSAGRYRSENDYSISNLYSKTVNDILLKHTYKIYSQMAKKFSWIYYDISGIIDENGETWFNIDGADETSAYREDKVHPTSFGNSNIAKLLESFLKENYKVEFPPVSGNVLFLGDSYTRNYSFLKRKNGNYVRSEDGLLWELKEGKSRSEFLHGWPEELAKIYNLSPEQFIDLGIGSSAFLPKDRYIKTDEIWKEQKDFWKLYRTQLRNFSTKINLLPFYLEKDVLDLTFDEDPEQKQLTFDNGRWNYSFDYDNPTYGKLKSYDLEAWTDELNYIIIGGGYNERVYMSNVQGWREEDYKKNSFDYLQHEIEKTKKEITFIQQKRMQKAWEKTWSQALQDNPDIENQEAEREVLFNNFYDNFPSLQIVYVALGYNRNSSSNMNIGLEKINNKIKEYWNSNGYYKGTILKDKYDNIIEPSIIDDKISLQQAFEKCSFSYVDIAKTWGYEKKECYVEDDAHPTYTGISNIATILTNYKILGEKPSPGLSTSYDGSYFTRFDSFGLYSIDNSKNFSFNYVGDGNVSSPWFEGLSREDCLKRIQEESLVSLTEKGFSLNVPGSEGGIKLGYRDVLKNDLYGLYIADKRGDLVVQLHNDANTNKISGWNISSDGMLHIGDSSEKSKKKIFSLSNKSRSSEDAKEIAVAIGTVNEEDADKKDFSSAAFQIMDDGTLIASGANISGSGLFSGSITAESGHIGAFSIVTRIEENNFDNMICIGDSYSIAGNTYKSGVNQRGWPEELASLLGTKKLYKKGQGSSGFSTGANKIEISPFYPRKIRGLMYYSYLNNNNETAEVYYHTDATNRWTVYSQDVKNATKVGEKMKEINSSNPPCFFVGKKGWLFYPKGNGEFSLLDLSTEKMTVGIAELIKDKAVENSADQFITKPSIQKYYYYGHIWQRGEKGEYKRTAVEEFFKDNNSSANKGKIYFIPELQKIFYYGNSGSTWKWIEKKQSDFSWPDDKVIREWETIISWSFYPEDGSINYPPEPVIMWYNQTDNAYWYQVPFTDIWERGSATSGLVLVGNPEKNYYLKNIGYFFYNRSQSAWEYTSTELADAVMLEHDPDGLCKSGDEDFKNYYIHAYTNTNFMFAKTFTRDNESCRQVIQKYSPSSFLNDNQNSYISEKNYIWISHTGNYYYYTGSEWKYASYGNHSLVSPRIQNYRYLLENFDFSREERENINAIVVCGGYMDRPYIKTNNGISSYYTTHIKEEIELFLAYSHGNFPNAKIYLFFAGRNENTNPTAETLNGYFENYVYPTYEKARDVFLEALGTSPANLINVYDISRMWAHIPSKDMQRDRVNPTFSGSSKIAVAAEGFMNKRTGVFYGQTTEDIESKKISSGFSFFDTGKTDVSFWAGYFGDKNPYEDSFDATEATFYTTYGGKMVAKAAVIGDVLVRSKSFSVAKDKSFELPEDFSSWEDLYGLYSFEIHPENEKNIYDRGRSELFNISPAQLMFAEKKAPVVEGGKKITGTTCAECIQIRYIDVPYTVPTQTNSGLGYTWDEKSRVKVPAIMFSSLKDKANLVSFIYGIDGAIFIWSRDGGTMRIA